MNHVLDGRPPTLALLSLHPNKLGRSGPGKWHVTLRASARRGPKAVVALPAVYEIRLSEFADVHLCFLVTATGTTVSSACSSSSLVVRGDETSIC
jgi:hypothetical protein